MSRGFKIVLVVFFVVTLICVIVQFLTRDTSLNKSVLENDTKANKLDGVVIKNERIINDNGELSVSFEIVNKKDSVQIESVELKVVDPSSKNISYSLLPINKKVEKNGSIKINTIDTVNHKEDDLKVIYKVNGRR